ncbi:MAG: LysM peptidoglycan-binding domain-containing protein, partial [Verrucomicrobiae bacterium]|nr:LysM peptidoglycan-binding domain-containing protein [Verrucomicrobiae bacterium]
TNQIKTNVVVRRQFFSWREIESPDYPTYIANLREIGCPESTIRDIIIADVNHLFALRRATEVITPAQEWWRSEPDPETVRAAEEKLRALEAERRALLTHLLGPDWEVAEATLPQVPQRGRVQITLDGPVLGVMPAEIKHAVQTIANRAYERIQDYIEQQRKAGREPDPLELARLRQQTRDELAQVLSPQQLEEFLLRYSETAERLRQHLAELKFFNPTPDEFRAMFHAWDAIEQNLARNYTSDSPGLAEARAALEAQREQAIRNALGPQRYEEYRRLQDPVYRDAVAAAQQAGAPGAAPVIYEIKREASAELARIQQDPTLSTAQKEIEMRKVELEQMKAIALALNQQITEETPPLPPVLVIHRLGPFDTIQNVAARFGVTVNDIVAANPGTDLSQLKPGDTIYVPVQRAHELQRTP